MEDLSDNSSEDYQYVEDIDNTDEIDIDDLNLIDIEEQKVDILTKQFYEFKDKLNKIDNLENIDLIKKDFRVLCENNRYLIDDSFFLKNLETNIYETISYYEAKLFKLYEELVNEQDFINLKIKQDEKIELELKLIHDRMIYGEKLQEEIENRKQLINSENST